MQLGGILKQTHTAREGVTHAPGSCMCCSLVAWLNAVPSCSGHFCKWCGQCLASFLYHCRLQFWKVTQLQCSHPQSLAHVVLYFSKSATAVCPAPSSSSSAVDSMLAPITYSSNANYHIMKGLVYEQGHVGKLYAACASGPARGFDCFLQSVLHKRLFMAPQDGL